MIKRSEVCIAIQESIEALVPLFEKYRHSAQEFKQLTRNTGGQVTSDWRIQNMFQEKLLGRVLDRGLKVLDLEEIENRIFTGVLQRAMRELDNNEG